MHVFVSSLSSQPVIYCIWGILNCCDMKNGSTERYSKSGNMTSSGENGINIRTNVCPTWDRTRYLEE